MRNITMLGIGAMGERMAARLLTAGYTLTIYNRTPKRCAALVPKGALSAESAQHAVRNADAVITMVTDDDAANAIWLSESTGAIHALPTDCTVIQSSTLSLAGTLALQQRIDAVGAHFIDAPVVGSLPQAESGQLLFLTAGEPQAIDRIRPVLSTMGNVMDALGPCGNGTLFKHAANAYFAIQVAALAELTGMMQQTTLPLSRITELFSDLPITSPPLQFALMQIAQQNYPAFFPIDLVAKDLRYMLASAETFTAETPTSAVVSGLFERAARRGHGDDNIAGIARLFTGTK